MEALKQLLLVEGGGCWKEGEGQSHLPVCGEREKQVWGASCALKMGNVAKGHVQKNLLKSEIPQPATPQKHENTRST